MELLTKKLDLIWTLLRVLNWFNEALFQQIVVVLLEAAMQNLSHGLMWISHVQFAVGAVGVSAESEQVLHGHLEHEVPDQRTVARRRHGADALPHRR